VYLEKRKSNTFDGFIGFTNTESAKLVFNGYLDLTLENALKAGEQFSLNWKSDGNNQKTFKASIDLPYLFKSPVGLKAQIYIFKQDRLRVFCRL
jgi:outer membrane protein assembly factor BamA